MSFWNTIRKVERFRFYISLFLVGVLFVGAACFALSLPKAERVSVDGTIQRIEAYIDSNGEEQQSVFVSYMDHDGVLHENVRYPSYSSSMAEGKTVTVVYDPSSPENISAPGAEFIPYIFVVIGIAAVAVSVFAIAKGFKEKESNSPFENAEKQADPRLAEQILEDDSPTRDYYFHWTGKLNQSYILETPERKAVYEAICDHIGVLTPYRYTFVNRSTGVSREHKVSHTVTNRYGNGLNSGVSFSIVSSSKFKIDDVNNWDYLAHMGYSIEPKRSGIKLNFDVLRYGVPVAYLEAAGANILRDGKQSLLGDKLTANGLFKVSCKDSDLEGVFMACFCASRVEFF